MEVAAPVLTEQQKQENIERSRGLLEIITDKLKETLTGIPAFARAITLIKGKTIKERINYTRPNDERDDIFSVPDSLSIVIGVYTFTLVSKVVLFDRRYVNFDVRGGDLEAGGLHLTAYASSSQVGSWRLCKNEPGNRLNKFDDYVQSTVIQWKLTRFICYWFYRHELLWDNEPTIRPAPGTILSDEENAENREITTRNTIRNNLFGVPQTQDHCHTWDNVNDKIAPPPGYNAHSIPKPHAANAAGQANFLAAIPYVYVMEGGLYEYKTFPEQYRIRTQDALDITCKIVDRGLGSRYKYSFMNFGKCSNNIVPLPAPCPFDYWKDDKGTCGDQNSEPKILDHLNRFSATLRDFYDIETVNPNDPASVMKITELYRDCMVYKNFKQEATVFKVRLIPKRGNKLCVPPNAGNIPANPSPGNGPGQSNTNFYQQPVDIVFVNFHMRQYTSNPDICLEPCYELDPQPQPQSKRKKQKKEVEVEEVERDFNVQGYYVLTIIPTCVLQITKNFGISTTIVTPCKFNKITSIGLYQFYIKAGYYVCKPLDYTGQCILRSFPINPGAQVIPQKINVEYAYIGHRLNGQEPFKRLFGFTDPEIAALSTYSEQIITSPETTVGKIGRTLSTAINDALKKTEIEQVKADCAPIGFSVGFASKNHVNKKPSRLIKGQNALPVDRVGGSKHKKTNKNKLQTNKKKPHKQEKIKRRTKKRQNKRRTKKR